MPTTAPVLVEMPACRVPAKDKVLYASDSGKWVVGNATSGQPPGGGSSWLRRSRKDATALPHELIGEWERIDQHGWHRDKSIRVRAVPTWLYVRCPAWPSHRGMYKLTETLRAGRPEWRRCRTNGKTNTDLLYLADDGRWTIAAEGLVILRHIDEHKGSLPHEMHSAWEAVAASGAGNETENECPASWCSNWGAAVVDAVPDQLLVRSTRTPSCQGIYELGEGSPDQMPVWRHAAKDRVLYYGNTGKWAVGDHDEEERHFDCSSGWLRHPNGDALPHLLTAGLWEWSDGKAWCGDSDISVAPPATSEELAHYREGKAHRKERMITIRRDVIFLVMLILGKVYTDKYGGLTLPFGLERLPNQWDAINFVGSQPIPVQILVGVAFGTLWFVGLWRWIRPLVQDDA